MPPSNRTRARVGVALAICATLAIEVVTLAPQFAVGGTRHLWRFTLDPLHARDIAGNVLLFVPLGAALAIAAWPARRAIPLAIGLSLLIELLQGTVAVGRFIEMQDVVTNTFGASLGWILASASLAFGRSLDRRD